MTWPLVSDYFAPEEEGFREALCALGNGYLVARGAAPESKANEIHYAQAITLQLPDGDPELRGGERREFVLG